MASESCRPGRCFERSFRPPSHWMSRTHHETLSGRESDRSNVSGDFAPMQKTYVCQPRNTCNEEVDRHVLLPHEFMSKLYHWDRCRFDKIMVRSKARVDAMQRMSQIQRTIQIQSNNMMYFDPSAVANAWNIANSTKCRNNAMAAGS